jgi:hypothetical protein
MYTLAVLTWISAFGVAGYVAAQVYVNTEQKRPAAFWLPLGGLLFVAFCLTCAALVDVFGHDPTETELSELSFFLLLGLVTLGTSSACIFLRQIVNGTWRPWKALPRDRGEFSGGKTVSIIGVISFLSALLGIVSFYLDHIRK